MLCPYPKCVWSNGGTLCSRFPCPRREEAMQELDKKITALQDKAGPSVWMPKGLAALQAEYDALTMEGSCDHEKQNIRRVRGEIQTEADYG